MSLSLLRGDPGSSPSAPHRAPRAPVADTEKAIDAPVRAADLGSSDVLPADVSSRDAARVDAATDVPAPLSTMPTRKPARPVHDSTEACSTGRSRAEPPSSRPPVLPPRGSCRPGRSASPRAPRRRRAKFAGTGEALLAGRLASIDDAAFQIVDRGTNRGGRLSETVVAARAVGRRRTGRDRTAPVARGEGSDFTCGPGRNHCLAGTCARARQRRDNARPARRRASLRPPPSLFTSRLTTPGHADQQRQRNPAQP